MMNVFVKDNKKIIQTTFENEDFKEQDHEILWIDLLHPTSVELNHIMECFGLNIPTHEEREEIEESARYFEDKEYITINTYFLIGNIKEGWDMYHNLQHQTITFLFYKNTLFTVRYSEFKTFDEIQNYLSKSTSKSMNGFEIIEKIFEYRIEKDADMLEKSAKDTRNLRSSIFEHRYHSEEVLSRLAQLQDFHMLLRDSLFDKKRAMTSLMKSEKGTKDFRKNISIILKDVNSLIDFINANMVSLDNIQNIFSNQINIEQNKVIKFFTVITVAFMPPTLVGTIYGMNFQNIPELQWDYGYPIAIGVMFASVIMPLMYFKIKKWL